MAVVTVSAYAKTLQRSITFTAYLPGDLIDETGTLAVQPPYKTLYLLHGITGSQNDWLHETKLVKYASQHQLAIVMPAGENLFYVDHTPPAPLFSQFIGEELVTLTRRLFPLSHERSDTYIAGLSMGGYGALCNGLKYAETFAAVGSFSGALVTDALIEPDNYLALKEEKWAPYVAAILGTGSSLCKSERNPNYLVEKLLMQNRPFPRLFLSCGTNDLLVTLNRSFVDFIKEKGLAVEYREAPGKHDWEFWDDSIEQFLGWLHSDEQTSNNIR